ncbi:MAG: PorV/PorQ family protein [bacterium]
MFHTHRWFVLLFIVLPFAGQAQTTSIAGAGFLTLPPGSRANAMGGAYTALADDIYALYFNPAGITRLQKGSIGFYHHQWLGMLPITFTGGVYNTRYGSFGFAFNNFDIDTKSSLGEELNSYERAFQVTYANKVGSHFAIGGTIKFVREKFDQPQDIPNVAANAWSFDIGVLVQNLFPHLTYTRRNEGFPEDFRRFDRKSFQGFAFGFALLNTGPNGFTFLDESQKDPLPQILRLGAALNAVDTEEIGLILAVDVDKLLVERDANGKAKGFVQSWFEAWDGGFDDLSFGAEFNLYHIFAFRFGRHEVLNFSPNQSIGEWTFGFGLGPEWARLNLVRRRFPIALSRDKWVVDFAVSY